MFGRAASAGNVALLSTFGALDPEDEQTAVADLVGKGARRFGGLWTDDPNLEVDGGGGTVVIEWAPGQPSARDLASLRSLNPAFRERSLTDLRIEATRERRLRFSMELGNHRQEREWLDRARSLGIHATYLATDFAPAWPPLSVAIRSFEAMWTTDRARYEVLTLGSAPEDAVVFNVVSGGPVLIEDDEIAMEVCRRLRDAGCPVRSALPR